MYKKLISKYLVSLLFFVSFAGVLLVSFYANKLISFSLETMQYNLERRLLAVSEQAAALVTAGELDAYRGAGDMSLAGYQALRARLLDFSKRADVTYVFFIRPTGDGRLQYIVDNDFAEETRVGLDTKPYTVLPWIAEALGGRTVCSGLGNYTPGWEGILSAYAPVFDGEGGVTALAGVDIWDAPIVEAQRKLKILRVIQILAVMVVFVSGLINLIRFRTEADRANQANRAKTSFLAQTSHEIRTPMNAVLGMSELALRADSLFQALEYVGGIKQAGNNLLSIINDILDISKIEAGVLEIHAAPYSLSSLLNDVINIIRVRAAEKPISLIVNVDARIPNELSGDEARIRQILLNLLFNAVKYTEKGFIRLTVRPGDPSPSSQNVTLIFEVEDSGIGIREKDLPNLFHRFTRLDMEKNYSIEGTGLGLAITRSLCQIMGGSVGVTSTYGEGSLFSVQLPQTCLADKPLAVVEKPLEKGVLCYEKRPLYAESLAYTLKNLGVPAKFCSEEEEFLRELEGGKYPFVFAPPEAAVKAASLAGSRGLLVLVAALIAQDELLEEKEGAVPITKLVLPVYALPVANVLNQENPLEPKKRPGGRFAAPSARILVVDDISTNLVVTEGLLAAYRSRVDTCTSGAEAVRIVQEHHYDLVFMDHMMPGMDGIESTRHIRELPGDYYQRLPVIALTANALVGMKELFLEQGFNDYLSKPIEIPKLDDIMETWIPADKKVQRGEDDQGEDPGTVLDGLTVEGLDLAAGKERYRERTYLEVLRSYTVHTPALVEKLRSLGRKTLSEETIGEYTITIHGLKGSTYGICANGLAKQAEDLERAARKGDLKYIEGENANFTKTVEGLLERIRGVLERAAAAQEAKPRAPSPSPLLLRQLREACQRYRANAVEETLAALESFDYESGSDLVVWLRGQADNLEYSAIVERLEGI
jgi:signal transduction histidine kinase/CheY-like chemotaxis protein